jgi:hypothetical protein
MNLQQIPMSHGGYPQAMNLQKQIPQQQLQQQQIPMSHGGYPQAPPTQPMNLQQQIPQQQKGGYTEAEVNVLRGKGNEERAEFDLGKDGAFSDFAVLVGLFCNQIKCWDQNSGKALSQKGFRVTYTTDEREFIRQLKNGANSFDVTWIVPTSDTTLNSVEQEEFKTLVLNYHRTGRGLFIYGDNSPYFLQANWILPDLVGTTLVGDTPGDRVLSYGNGKTAGEFDANHLIFAGINYLYEGVTICYPQTDGKLTHLATSSDGHPCISFLESTPEHGRVLLDTGFTKLSYSWNSAGQARYVVNVTVYLVDVERRFKS